jgi:hypothetical protein
VAKPTSSRIEGRSLVTNIRTKQMDHSVEHSYLAICEAASPAVSSVNMT